MIAGEMSVAGVAQQCWTSANGGYVVTSRATSRELCSRAVDPVAAIGFAPSISGSPSTSANSSVVSSPLTNAFTLTSQPLGTLRFVRNCRLTKTFFGVPRKCIKCDKVILLTAGYACQFCRFVAEGLADAFPGRSTDQRRGNTCQTLPICDPSATQAVIKLEFYLQIPVSPTMRRPRRRQPARRASRVLTESCAARRGGRVDRRAHARRHGAHRTMVHLATIAAAVVTVGAAVGTVDH